jgi:hypothetical protein
MPWAREHGLRICTRYKDDVVRTFEYPNRVHGVYQIWIDLPADTDRVVIHVWRRTQRGTVDLVAKHAELKQKLDEALQIAKSNQDTGIKPKDPTFRQLFWMFLRNFRTRS